MVRDEVSQELRKQGQISITAIMMAGFDILARRGVRKNEIQDQHLIMDDKLEFRFPGLRGPPGGRIAPLFEGAAMPYRTKAVIAGVFTETVEPGAFAGRMNDVVVNYMHQREAPIARTDGGGLTLTDSSTRRLTARVEIPAYREDIIDQVKAENLEGLFQRRNVSSKMRTWPETR